jgi:hypothetical protein
VATRQLEGKRGGGERDVDDVRVGARRGRDREHRERARARNEEARSVHVVE